MDHTRYKIVRSEVDSSGLPVHVRRYEFKVVDIQTNKVVRKWIKNMSLRSIEEILQTLPPTEEDVVAA